MKNIMDAPATSDDAYIGRLDIQLLRSFLAIARAPTLSKAAVELNIPQPTMSLQMKRLEDRAGKLLFEPGRRGKPLRLTLQGERLVGHAERIITAYEDTVDFLGSPELSGTLRLGIRGMVSETGIRNILSRFKAIYEDVQLTIIPARVGSFTKMIEEDSIDAFICTDKPHPSKVRVLWSELFHWVCAKDKTVLSKDPLPIALISDAEPFRKYISDLLDAKGLTWNEAYSSDSFAKIYASAAAGQTLAAVSASLINGDVTIVDDEISLPRLEQTTFSMYQSPRVSKDAEKLIHALSEFIFLKTKCKN